VAPAPAPKPAPAPAAASAAPAAAPSEESGGLGSWLDNPLILSVGGVLVALLAGLGFYRLRNKVKKDSGETSFLESRLQPDSFFGASGGQRIDTRDAGGASSSMSYSLSQLDAIGDVDPVAEADVYLAYGRDLQAEEILKEAMRANPERLAVRTKLLEVYAKRRDAKGFELLATQLYSLTRGEGEDWAKAQELGLQIDPENPLYRPGGRPEARPGVDGDGMVEPLGASTMPQSVLPTPSKFTPTTQQSESGFGLDLDLDLDLPGGDHAPAARAPEVTQPFRNDAQASSNGLDFDLSDEVTQARAPAAPAQPAKMDFNLDDLQFDSPASAQAPSSTFGLDDVNDDPLARKLELAEEFRQIGDMEGARDLLQEVVAKAEGALKSRAQGMLDDIS
jgi:pilus assembly protein FimV